MTDYNCRNCYSDVCLMYGCHEMARHTLSARRAPRLTLNSYHANLWVWGLDLEEPLLCIAEVLVLWSCKRRRMIFHLPLKLWTVLVLQTLTQVSRTIILSKERHHFQGDEYTCMLKIMRDSREEDANTESCTAIPMTDWNFTTWYFTSGTEILLLTEAKSITEIWLFQSVYEIWKKFLCKTQLKYQQAVKSYKHWNGIEGAQTCVQHDLNSSWVTRLNLMP